MTIETEASVENLDAILDVSELGFVFIGPLNLSVSLGCPGEIDHPNVQEAVETIRSTGSMLVFPSAASDSGWTMSTRRHRTATRC